MPDVILTITIPEGKVATALERFLKIFPNTEVEEDGETPKYTDKQWVEEYLKKRLREDISRGKEMLDAEANGDPFDKTLVV